MNEKLMVLPSVVGLSIGAWSAYTHAAEKPALTAGCTTPCAPGKLSCSAPAVMLTAEEQKAADWVVSEIRKAGSIDGALDGRSAVAFLASGGFDRHRLDMGRLKQGVEVALQACGSELSLSRLPVEIEYVNPAFFGRATAEVWVQSVA